MAQRLLRRRLSLPDDDEVLEELSRYLLLEEGRAKATVRGYSQQARAVAKMVGKKIAAVTPEDIRHKVKRDQECAPSTKELRVAAFRAVHKWALLERKPWADAAMLGVKIPPSRRRLPRAPISPFDAQKLLAHCQIPNDYRVIYFGLYAGMRVGESASITTKQVHRDRITFIGKGDKERSVPIHPELRKVLPIILSVTPRSEGVLQGRMRELRDRLDVRDEEKNPATTHSLRRTFADFLYDKLKTEREVVRMILGHGSEVTDLYAPVRFPRMREAVERLDYSIGEPVQLSLFK